jgi:hypothetical protein
MSRIACLDDLFGVVGRKKVTYSPKDEPLKLDAIGPEGGPFLIRAVL